MVDKDDIDAGARLQTLKHVYVKKQQQRSIYFQLESNQ